MTVRNAPNGMQVCEYGRWVCARCKCEVEADHYRVHYTQPRCECPPEGEDPGHVDRVIIGTAFKLAMCIVLALVLAPLLSGCGRHNDGMGNLYKGVACQYGTDKCTR